MKHFYFIILFLFSSFVLPAQEKELEQEIMNYSETRSSLISKGRKLLLDKFLEGDFEKVEQVKDYLLNEVQNQDYVALYPGETIMIMYWTGEYEELLQQILQLELESYQNYNLKILPERDLLFTRLLEYSGNELQMLEYHIHKSPLDEEKKDFLLLYLHYIISGEPLLKITQEEVNTMADLYLETHPGSPYEEYIRNNIRFKFAPSKFGFGVEFFTGYGLLTGELSEMYNNQGILGLTFDLDYEKFTLYLRGHLGYAKTKQDQENDGVVWPEDSNSLMFLPEASIGYAVVDNDKIKLSPYAGIGLAGVGPVQPDLDERPELEAVEIGTSAAYTLGINLNFKLGWTTAPYISVIEDKSYWYVRLRYGYTLPQFNDFPMHQGNVHHFTIGIGGLYRGMKRTL